MNVGVLLDGARRLFRMEQMVGIDAVDDVDVVPLLAERAAKTLQENSVTAEAVGRIERGEMQKLERAAHQAATSRINFFN